MMDSPFRFTNDTGGGGMGGYGHQGGLGGLAQGYNTYLQGLGWDGQGSRHDFAQGLRQDGQHPWLDYRHSLQPNTGQGPMSFPPIGGATQGNGAGGGINPGSYNGSGINPGFGQWNQPHTMPGPFGGFPGTGPQGLMAMSRWQR